MGWGGGVGNRNRKKQRVENLHMEIRQNYGMYYGMYSLQISQLLLLSVTVEVTN